jgi:hypothetical protein
MQDRAREIQHESARQRAATMLIALARSVRHQQSLGASSHEAAEQLELLARTVALK